MRLSSAETTVELSHSNKTRCPRHFLPHNAAARSKGRNSIFTIDREHLRSLHSHCSQLFNQIAPYPCVSDASERTVTVGRARPSSCSIDELFQSVINMSNQCRSANVSLLRQTRLTKNWVEYNTVVSPGNRLHGLSCNMFV